MNALCVLCLNIKIIYQKNQGLIFFYESGR